MSENQTEMGGMVRTELLQVADAVAREKAIEPAEVLEAMEQAIAKAGRQKYGADHDIRAHIDRKSGEITLDRHRLIVEQVEDPNIEIPLDEARAIRAEAELGEEIVERLPPVDFGRISAQMAKQVIVQRVREAERARQYEEYKHRVGELINGIVKRVEYGNVTVDLGRAEAMLRREEGIPREYFKNGDRVRALILDVREEPRGPQIFLSRSHPDFMKGLFIQEVPEIYDGIVEIKRAARDPGSRAKIAVTSNDPAIDPVGACVGMRGSRVQAVVGELQGEKIDIVPWSYDPATFVVNCLAPAEVAKIVLDEDEGRVDVVVPDDQLSLAIGRRGQNVRLASMISGWDIDIMTEAEESEKRARELQERSTLFIEALDVDDVIGHLLVAEGFSTVEEIAVTPVEELAEIEGFDEEIAEELRLRAQSWKDAHEAHIARRLEELVIAEDLIAFEGLTPEQKVTLGENEIRSRDDLAELAGDELREILGEDALTESQANNLIMEARAHWFAEEDAAAQAAAAEGESEGESEAATASGAAAGAAAGAG